MHMAKCARYLMYVLPYLFLWKRYVLLNRLLDYQFQVSFLSPLHCYEELVQLVVDEPVEVLHYVHMV